MSDMIALRKAPQHPLRAALARLRLPPMLVVEDVGCPRCIGTPVSWCPVCHGHGRYTHVRGRPLILAAIGAGFALGGAICALVAAIVMVFG